MLELFQKTISPTTKPLRIFTLITHLDRISGFQEFFRDLDNEEKKSPFGFSFELDNSFDFSKHITTKINKVLKNINQIQLSRFPMETNPAIIEKLQVFPCNLEKAMGPVKFFLESLYNACKSLHVEIFGLYFSSTHQSKDTIDFTNKQLQTYFHFPKQTTDIALMDKPVEIRQRPYFITHLLEKIIMARLAEKHKKSLSPIIKITRALTITGALAFLGIVINTELLHFTHETQWIKKIEQTISEHNAYKTLIDKDQSNNQDKQLVETIHLLDYLNKIENPPLDNPKLLPWIIGSEANSIIKASRKNLPC